MSLYGLIETVISSVCWRSRVLYNVDEQYINLQIYRLLKEKDGKDNT